MKKQSRKKQSSLSAVEVEVLEFWEDLFPIDLIRLNKRLLPDSVRLPKRSASDSEWLKFYKSISPPQIWKSVDIVGVLNFPIVDARDLTEQLGGKSGTLGASHKNLVSSLNSSDFPLKGISATLKPVVTRSLIAGFKGCAQGYDRCRDRAETDRALGECEREYHGCAAIWELQIFLILLKEILPQLFPPWPRPPWSLR